MSIRTVWTKSYLHWTCDFSNPTKSHLHAVTSALESCSELSQWSDPSSWAFTCLSSELVSVTRWRILPTVGAVWFFIAGPSYPSLFSLEWLSTWCSRWIRTFRFLFVVSLRRFAWIITGVFGIMDDVLSAVLSIEGSLCGIKCYMIPIARSLSPLFSVQT